MECLRQSFISWYDSKPKGIGIRCKKAIGEMKNKNKLAASKDGNALGNGGLMRAMPCAITNNLLLNTLQSRMTHDNDICTQTIIIYQDAIKDYLDNNYVNDYNLELLKPLGHVINTLNNALYWSQSNTFEEAIVGAVNHGGDADTIAAITGSLAGARFGYDEIPERWINQLNFDVKEKLEKFYEFVIKTLDI